MEARVRSIFEWFVAVVTGKKMLNPFLGCDHPKPNTDFTVAYRGREVELSGKRVCRDCAPAYLRSVCTTCAVCKRPIFPMETVGTAPSGSKFPYVHTDWDCIYSGIQYCGMWGEGRLITLHELDPQTYPKGTVNVGDAFMKTGKAIAGIIR